MSFQRRPFLCAVTLAVQQCANFAVAQMYEFKSSQIPGNRSLHTLHAFYVYSQDEAPVRSADKLFVPFVKFSNFSASSTSKTRSQAELSNYRGVQLSIMRYKHFWDLIHPHKFCSTWDDVQQGRAEYQDQLLVQKKHDQRFLDVDVYIHTIRFDTAPEDNGSQVQRTGVYILVFSNCGDLNVNDAVVSGTVVVRNAYGFLPGNEYHKMPFYGWLSLVYVGLGVIWMGLSIRWWKELFNIQNCISFVILFGLLEAFLWYIFLNDWNHRGTRATFLFIFSLLLTVLKTTFSYMLVLVASLGWGITRPYLDHGVILKIQVLCFFYIVLDFIRECVLALRHSHSLSIAFVLLCLLPVSLLNGGIFYWVFTALSSLMETLKERCQSEKLILFQRLWHILIIALGIATFTLLFQIFNLSKDSISRWKYQWLLTDAVSHALFLMVLAAMMYLWAPHKYSQRYAYSTQIGEQDLGNQPADRPGSAVWADDDEDEEEKDSFWATTHQRDADLPKGPVEVVGASSSDKV